MLSIAHFELFKKYANAGGHAFSAGLVTEPDKDLYQELFASLQQAPKQAIATAPFADVFETWSTKFSRNGGVQGHRPVDLWSSVINVESEIFGRCPQVYLIASERGLEIGFAVAIHEDDYYNQRIKQKQRGVVPFCIGNYRMRPQSLFLTWMQAYHATGSGNLEQRRANSVVPTLAHSQN